MNFSILLSFGFHVLKRLAEKNLYTYKPTTGENLSVKYSNTSEKKRALPLAMLHSICTRKMEWLSNVEKL